MLFRKRAGTSSLPQFALYSNQMPGERKKNQLLNFKKKQKVRGLLSLKNVYLKNSFMNQNDFELDRKAEEVVNANKRTVQTCALETRSGALSMQKNGGNVVSPRKQKPVEKKNLIEWKGVKNTILNLGGKTRGHRLRAYFARHLGLREISAGNSNGGEVKKLGAEVTGRSLCNSAEGLKPAQLTDCHFTSKPTQQPSKGFANYPPTRGAPQGESEVEKGRRKEVRIFAGFRFQKGEAFGMEERGKAYLGFN